MNRKQFELNKLKIDSSGKVEISYKRMVTDGSATYADTIEVSSPRVPHPDMNEALDALKHALAESNSLFVHRNDKVLSPSLRKNLEGKIMERVLNAWDGVVLDSVEVSGVSIQGDLESGSCVITGKHNTHGTATAMNSPKISFKGDSFKIETEVRDQVKKIHEEAYCYIFENKAAQQEIPFGKAEETNKKAPVNTQEEDLVDA